MVHKFKGGVIVDNTLISNGQRTSPTASITVAEKGSVIHRSVLSLAAKSVSVLAANDYGSTKLVDLPNTNILIVGCIVDLTATLTGGCLTAGAATVDVAIGTVATTTTAFSNAGEKNLCPKIDMSAGGVAQGANTASETNVLIAAGASNAIYLNVGEVISPPDGTVVFSGLITILYVDLGVHA
jgi:hypothetical protein